MISEIVIPKPVDFHVHLRQGKELEHYTKDCSAHFSKAIIMPNTIPPITNAYEIEEYKKQILLHAKDFEPLMTFKIMANHNPKDMKALKNAGAIAGKLYPQGATTNSQDGVAEIDALYPVFEAMQDENLVLCLHGEDPKAFSLERESAFLPQIKKILKTFPRLRVVFEHVSTKEGIEFVQSGPENLAATLTTHHPLFDLDALIGGHLNPHYFCKPILKTPSDRMALKKAMLSGHPRIFFGSDSAPHDKVKKECDCGAAGVYSMPVSLPLLTQIFMEESNLDALINYTSRFGCKFYQIPESKTQIKLFRESWTIPELTHGVVPLMAGEVLEWKVV